LTSGLRVELDEDTLDGAQEPRDFVLDQFPDHQKVDSEMVVNEHVKAPLAKVTLGSGNSLSFAGTVAAREIVLRPGVSFTCETN
jgi:hypothetical protein